MDKEIKLKKVTASITFTVTVPFIEGKTDLNKEVDDLIENIAETHDFEDWEYNQPVQTSNSRLTTS